MKLTPRQYASALHQAISETKQGDHDKVLDNFVATLKHNGDLALFPEIEREFEAYEREQRGGKLGQVTSARELTHEQERALVTELETYVGGKVELEKAVDESLLGGVIVQIGDEVLDSSLKRNLRDLKKDLIK